MNPAVVISFYISKLSVSTFAKKVNKLQMNRGSVTLPFVVKLGVSTFATKAHEFHEAQETSSVQVCDIIDRATGKNSEYQYLRQPGLRRFDSECFFGKRFNDKNLNCGSDMKDLKGKVAELLRRKNQEPIEYLKIAEKARNLLFEAENMPYDLCVPKDLMYFDKNSPYRPFLDKALMKCFRTSWNAVHDHHENFSGWALAGTRGTGKSNMTRLVALLSGILLPNFQSVFVGAADVQNLSIAEVVKFAAVEAGIIPKDCADYSLGDVIGSFSKAKCAIGLFVDELPVEYKLDDSNWKNIHTLAGTTEPTFVLVNGSARILPAMVKADLDDYPMLRRYLSSDENVRPLESLNGTKLQVEYLPRFSTEQHYLDYFKHLNVEFPEVKALVNKAHVFSGGILRSLREELSTYSQSYALLLRRWRSKYPGEGSLERKIFSVLAEKYVEGGSSDKYDIFNMPVITEAELLEVIKKFGVTNEYQALQKLVEDGTLNVRNDTTAVYTYGVPAYFLLSLNKPVIFVSHRWCSATVNSSTFLLLNDLVKEHTNMIFIACEDPAAQEAMRHCGIKRWQNSQCVVSVPKVYSDLVQRAGVALIDEPYLLRLEEYHRDNKHNGCSEEFESLLKQNRSARVLMIKEKTLRLSNVKERLTKCFPLYTATIQKLHFFSHGSAKLTKALQSISNNAMSGYPELDVGLVMNDTKSKE
eukprot:CAMPEP_0170369918 /NCGR_PEP_ID=MMETSP0117_2-20130122/8237_1 /TAXON_ID=400756 /ORGANISM="Durinskia baltica, Strain CSIRO CS-38" /LENGTH=697 /DNA_ID=CAMNT_0010624665 /DNA_START=141 /DNA_END=2234 /DNA_ORIENTATION=-